MAQEQSAGPEYVTEFDPEKFLRELAAQGKAQEEFQGKTAKQDSAVERTE